MHLPSNIQLEATSGQLTFRVTGVLLADDVIGAVKASYDGFAGKRILWDVTAAEVSAVTSDDFARVAIVVRDHTPKRVERRTAFVVADHAASVAFWKYLNQLTRLHVPVEYRVFTDRAAAQRWLEQV